MRSWPPSPSASARQGGCLLGRTGPPGTQTGEKKNRNATSHISDWSDCNYMMSKNEVYKSLGREIGKIQEVKSALRLEVHEFLHLTTGRKQPQTKFHFLQT
jgi:hypothetical protein